MSKKIAIVTGASRGIGAATAQLLARQGYAVCINYHSSADKAQKIISTITQQGGKAIAVKADMAKEKDIMQLFDTVDKELGTVTALVNNAGINGGISTVEDITADCLHSVFATNVYAAFLCSREAIKRMKDIGNGSIVNVSSETARFGGTKLAHYAASKAAINTFTIGIAREVAPYQIRVNAVSPGVVDTEIHHGSPPERLQKLIESLPMGRMGTPEEVAKTIVWLLSDEASYVSGTIVPVTGSR